MKAKNIAAVMGIALSLTAVPSMAAIDEVQVRIAGYLCGF